MMQRNPGEKRQHPRVDARIQVEFKTEQEFATCYSKNISRGGIFLETDILPDPNATVELVLDLSEFSEDADTKQVSIRGRVVRLMTITESSKQIHKIAVQFVSVEPYVQVMLDRLYEKLKR